MGGRATLLRSASVAVVRAYCRVLLAGAAPYWMIGATNQAQLQRAVTTEDRHVGARRREARPLAIGHYALVSRVEPEPWPDPDVVARESAALGFEAEPASVPVLGTRWLSPASLPWTTPVPGGRLLLLGPSRAALFSTDYRREHLVEHLWSGRTAELRWRRLGGWLIRIETPDGGNLYPDSLAERRKLETAARNA